MSEQDKTAYYLEIARKRDALVKNAEELLVLLGSSKEEFLSAMEAFGTYGIGVKANRDNASSLLHMEFMQRFGERRKVLLRDMTSNDDFYNIVFEYVSLAHAPFESQSTKLEKLAQHSKDEEGIVNVKKSFKNMLIDFMNAM